MTNRQQSVISIFGTAVGTMLKLFCAAVFATTTWVEAQTFTVIHSFSGPDGSNPFAGPTIDRAGNLYGTTKYGGLSSGFCANTGCGTVFKLSQRNSRWVLSELYEFNSTDGATPTSRAVFGADGTLYGATPGTVYNLRPAATICASVSCPWVETTLYTFSEEIGGITGDVAFDSAGNIYATTYLGGDYQVPSCFGLGCGTVFELSRSENTWTETTLYEFLDLGDGEYPNSGVIVDGSGNLYGTAPQDGIGDECGTVFELTPSGSGWTFSLPYRFQCAADGAHPYGALIFDREGNLYGSTSSEGTNHGGTVFQLSLSPSGWNFNLLYSLNGPISTLPGPAAKLLLGTDGNLYGSSVKDGAYDFGSIFQLTPTNGGWTYTSLHDFTGGSDGAYPYDGLVMDANGNLFGTAQGGGNTNPSCLDGHCGVVFEITP